MDIQASSADGARVLHDHTGEDGFRTQLTIKPDGTLSVILERNGQSIRRTISALDTPYNADPVANHATSGLGPKDYARVCHEVGVAYDLLPTEKPEVDVAAWEGP